MPPSRSSADGAQVSVLAEAVAHGRAADLRQDLAHHLVVAAQHGEPVERQVVQELDEALLQLLEVAAVRAEVVVVDVGDDRDHRLQVQERRVALVGLGDQVAARAELGVAASALQQPADHECRVEAALGEHGGDEARGRRLAVGAGDGDALAEAHELAEHLGAAHHRDARGSGSFELGVVRRDGGGHDDDARARDLPRLVADEDPHAHRAPAAR